VAAEPSVIAQIWAARGVAWRLAERDLRAQYRQAFLGVIWAFVPPIALTIGCTLAARANVLPLGGTDLPYPLYVFSGTVLWQTFIESLLGPAQAYAASKQLIAKINFPKETLIIAKAVEIAFNLAIKLLLLAGAFAWYAQPVGAMAVLALPVLAATVVAGLGVGLMAAPLSLLYDDVPKGLALISGYWFFLTPVAYAPPAAGLFAEIVRWNPMTHLVVPWRELLASLPPSHPWLLAAVAAAGVVLLLLAVAVNRAVLPIAIERVGA
jgi:lipopolysaccharide transport system permease protein